MAATVSLSFSLDPQHHYLSHNAHFKSLQTFPLTPPFPIPKHPLLLSHRYNRYASKSPSSSSHSTPSTPKSLPYSEDPFRTGRFLSNEELEKLKILANFRYCQELESGSLWVRVMRAEEMDAIVALLAKSFAESMLWPSGYLSLLIFLVKQYLIERRALMPHTATLIGFYRGKANGVLEEEAEEEGQLAGTVEVCFDKRGANTSPPTPTAPKNSPYISNMTVKQPLRRRGIGWHLLKASEQLISQMSFSREVYLHCRMIDVAPFNMYTKAGYNIVKTDSILILLMLQRRKHLMCKKLPAIRIPSDMSDSDEE